MGRSRSCQLSHALSVQKEHGPQVFQAPQTGPKPRLIRHRKTLEQLLRPGLPLVIDPTQKQNMGRYQLFHFEEGGAALSEHPPKGCQSRSEAGGVHRGRVEPQQATPARRKQLGRSLQRPFCGHNAGARPFGALGSHASCDPAVGRLLMVRSTTCDSISSIPPSPPGSAER